MPLSSVLGAQSLVRPGVCTSSTRPASPFEGQVIYETDTDFVKAYDGSSWVNVGPYSSFIKSDWVATNQTTTSTSYTDLTTTGPTVTVTTGTTALALFGCQANDVSNSGASGYMSVEVSGASTVAASDTWAAFLSGAAYADNVNATIMLGYRFTGLTAGSNTFTAKYKRSGGTSAGFLSRWLTVIAL